MRTEGLTAQWMSPRQRVFLTAQWTLPIAAVRSTFCLPPPCLGDPALHSGNRPPFISTLEHPLLCPKRQPSAVSTMLDAPHPVHTCLYSLHTCLGSLHTPPLPPPSASSPRCMLHVVLTLILTSSTLPVPQSIISTMDGWVRSMSFGCSDSPGDPGVFYAVKRLCEGREELQPPKWGPWCCLWYADDGRAADSGPLNRSEQQALLPPSSCM